jgi:flagellar P-ring protein FlgI
MTGVLGTLQAMIATFRACPPRTHLRGTATSAHHLNRNRATWPHEAGVFMRLLMAACAMATSSLAMAGDLQEYTRLRGLEGDQLIGIGLVVGLAKTGDSMKDSTITAQPYAQLLANMGNIRSDFSSLMKTKSVALVYVTVEIPRTGARTDDRLDIRVVSMGTASSLAGGQLVTSFLKSPVVPSDRSRWVPYAVAEGRLEIDSDAATNAVVRGGARMVRDMIMSPFEGDSVSLVLFPQYAGYPTAASIADLVNDELSLSGYSDAAKVEDAQTIRVRIPEAARKDPNSFVARLMTFSVPNDLIRTPARIVIDVAHEVITVDERVEFRPAAVTASNLRITTITPEIVATPDAPIADTIQWAGIATGDSARGSMKLKVLLDALIELDVPFDTQVAIIESLARQGALKAEIVKS